MIKQTCRRKHSGMLVMCKVFMLLPSTKRTPGTVLLLSTYVDSQNCPLVSHKKRRLLSQPSLHPQCYHFTKSALCFSHPKSMQIAVLICCHNRLSHSKVRLRLFTGLEVMLLVACGRLQDNPFDIMHIQHGMLN